MEAIINKSTIGIFIDGEFKTVMMESPIYDEILDALEACDEETIRDLLLELEEEVDEEVEDLETEDTGRGSNPYFRGRKQGRADALCGVPYRDNLNGSEKYRIGYRNGYFNN